MLNVTILTALLNLFAPATPVAKDTNTTATTQSISTPTVSSKIEEEVQI